MEPAPIKEPIVGQDGNISRTWVRWFQSAQIAIESAALVSVRIAASDSPYLLPNFGTNLICDTDGGAVVVNLPAGVDNKRMRIVNAGSSGNAVTVDGNGVELVIGAASRTVSDGSLIDIIYNSVEGWR